jgi:UrcA family protein
MLQAIARYAPAVAALGALIGNSVGLAAEPESRTEMPSVTVRYADLDLNTPAGVEALYGRLRAAARAVCNVDERRPLVEVMAAKSCYLQVLGTAVDDAKLPTLTALYRAGNGRAGRS